MTKKTTIQKNQKILPAKMFVIFCKAKNFDAKSKDIIYFMTKYVCIIFIIWYILLHLIKGVLLLMGLKLTYSLINVVGTKIAYEYV